MSTIIIYTCKLNLVKLVKQKLSIRNVIIIPEHLKTGLLRYGQGISSIITLSFLILKIV